MMRIEIGMRSDEFWDLTWYELYGWIGHINRNTRVRKEDRELSVELQRSWMALYANSHLERGKTPYSPRDFFELSYDTKILAQDVKKYEKGDLMKAMDWILKPKKKK